MRNYKRALCALLVTASVAGTSHFITASADKVKNVSENKVTLNNEFIIPERTLSAKVESTELEGIMPKKIMNVKDVLAVKAEEAKLAAAKAEEAKAIAAKAEKVRLAAIAEKAKLAAKKTASAKKVAAAKTTKSKTIVVASRGTSLTTVSSEKSQEIINYAKQFMGIQYVFGGASPSGFDCSGFTMYVFNKFGIDLPHSASGQAGLGRAVSKSDLVPGDLVFFETYKPGISHVGIYIGSGNFLEASSSRGIAITSLSSSYYSSRYRGATRILK